MVTGSFLFSAMTTVKLTKKQQKAAAFRGKKGRGREDPQDVPIMDDLAADDGFGPIVVEPLKAKAVKPEELPSKSPRKKRKRDEDVSATNDLPNKRIKGAATSEDTKNAKPKEKKQAADPKYILFVGKCTLVRTKVILTRRREPELQNNYRINRRTLCGLWYVQLKTLYDDSQPFNRSATDYSTIDQPKRSQRHSTEAGKVKRMRFS